MLKLYYTEKYNKIKRLRTTGFQFKMIAIAKYSLSIKSYFVSYRIRKIFNQKPLSRRNCLYPSDNKNISELIIYKAAYYFCIIMHNTSVFTKRIFD